MPGFKDTQTAFEYKTNRELRKAQFLFRTVANKSMVKIGKFFVNLALKIRFPIEWIIKPTIYSHFCGGESLENCQKVVEKLAKYQVKSILDYSVEGKQNDESILAALEETLRSIRHAAAQPHIPFAVFKPTAFCRSEILLKASEGTKLSPEEDHEAQKFINRIDRLCQTAYQNNVPILIDAEDSYYQNFIDHVVTKMMEKYNRQRAIVFNTLQMYRHDRLEFLKKAYEKADKGKYFLGVKFVRGAYMEKERERASQMGYPSPIQPDKESTDRDYNAALLFSVQHLERMAVFNGTHNEKSSHYLAQLLDQYQIAKNDPRVWFSQLYGMSDHISFNLAKQGYNVAKYVPYGPVKHVLPYLIRRAEENTSVAGQTGRELSLIRNELKRRKGKK